MQPKVKVEAGEGGKVSHYVLMTPDCRVVCVDRQGHFCEHHAPGSVAFSGLTAIDAFVSGQMRFVYAVQRGAFWFLYTESYNTDEQERMWYHPDSARWESLPPDSGMNREERGLGGYILRYQQDYLAPEGIDALCFEAGRVNDASVLRFLTEERFALFTDLITTQWACGPEGRLSRIDMVRSMAEGVRLGNISVPLETLLRAAEEAAQNPEITGELLFNQDWKIWRFARYNPLIVLEAFGSEAMEELAVQLSTLFRFGRYGGEHKGDILILTEYDATECQKIIDFALPEQPHKENIIKVIVTSGKGRLAAFRARRNLFAEGERLSAYAPILFCGTGVIFDNDVGSLLRKGCLARQIVSVGQYGLPSEVPSLSSSSVGQAEEPENREVLLPEACGRLMLLPHMGSLCQGAVRAGFEGFERYRGYYGEEAFGVEPQVILNSLLRRIAFLTTSIMDKAVRIATGGKSDPYNATGLICFAREEGRYKEMSRYLGELNVLKESIWR